MKGLNQKIIILAVLILANVSFAGTYSGGNGSELQPYQIADSDDWQELMTTSDDWGSSFILTADVNLAGITLTPVGNSSTPFTGVFDGQGYVIRNAVINLPGNNDVGLFGYVTGQIHNLGVEDVNVIGNNNVGGLVGYSIGGTITSCYATGAVSGNIFVGGLTGWNYMGSRITNCYSTGSVSGNDDVGGLVGLNAAATITKCFWDVNTSGQPIRSSGGIGLPTAAMQDSETYLRAFWDFKGEIKNGTNDTWAMPQGGGYPVLAWQLGDSPVSNDEMNDAIAVTAGSVVSGTSIGATGVDITRNGYKDSTDVWYYFDCNETDKYTITVEP